MLKECRPRFREEFAFLTTDRQGDKNIIFDVFRFVLSEAGLLLTARPLDREERDSYMVTMVMGRKGILRGKQAIQVKVSGD